MTNPAQPQPPDNQPSHPHHNDSQPSPAPPFSLESWPSLPLRFRIAIAELARLTGLSEAQVKARLAQREQEFRAYGVRVNLAVSAGCHLCLVTTAPPNRDLPCTRVLFNYPRDSQQRRWRRVALPITALAAQQRAYRGYACRTAVLPGGAALEN